MHRRALSPRPHSSSSPVLHPPPPPMPPHLIPPHHHITHRSHYLIPPSSPILAHSYRIINFCTSPPHTCLKPPHSIPPCTSCFHPATLAPFIYNLYFTLPPFLSIFHTLRYIPSMLILACYILHLFTSLPSPSSPFFSPTHPLPSIPLLPPPPPPPSLPIAASHSAASTSAVSYAAFPLAAGSYQISVMR